MRSVWHDDGRQAEVLARNMTGRYLAIGTDILIGLVLLPFNVAHLGKEQYGLWMLVASVTSYASLLELGYGGALSKYVAQHRGLRDPDALNEFTSTTLALYTAIGSLVLVLAVLAAFNLQHLFKLDQGEVATGRAVLLIVGAYVAGSFAFRPFGTIPIGFQRTYWSSLISIATSVSVAVVNLVVLLLGFGLVPLVAAISLVRGLGLLAYRSLAYRVFPGLEVRLSRVRISRLRELTGFSVYMLLLDLAFQVSFGSQALVIGALLGSAAVAAWTVAERLAQAALRLTNQMSAALFPLVVDSGTRRSDRLGTILVQGTRLSLSAVIPVAGGMALVASPVVRAFVGPGFTESVVAVQVLALVVAIRVGFAVAVTILKGAGGHRIATAGAVASAMATVLLCVLAVPRFGLAGAAVGMLLPAAAAHFCVFLPAACRRAGVKVAAVLWHAVWPALWPAAPAALLFVGLRAWQGGGVVPQLAHLGSSTVVYYSIFAGIALSAADRRLYWVKLRQAFGGRRSVETVA